MKKVVIIHFHPLELYPPIQNLLSYLDKNTKEVKIYVYTNQMASASVSMFRVADKNIEIVRLATSGKELNSLKRYWNYMKFYISALFFLLIKNPFSILYFETLSSYPALIYKKYFNRSVKLLIHYHEYMSPEEYKSQMLLVNFFHKLEKKIIPLTSWVSHTNNYRMDMFKKDIAPIEIQHSFILPNYPPAYWRRTKINIDENKIIHCVHAGAVNLDNMYMKEFANWVISKNGKVIWHLYSLMITNEARAFFSSLSCPWIQLYAGVKYADLPDLLSKYDVGVVLYKGHGANHIYSVPNKVFEYLAVGLDVWLQQSLIASLEYVTKGTYPKLIAVDFSKFETFDLEAAVNKNDCLHNIKPFFAENVLNTLEMELLH